MPSPGAWNKIYLNFKGDALNRVLCRASNSAELIDAASCKHLPVVTINSGMNLEQLNSIQQKSIDKSPPDCNIIVWMYSTTTVLVPVRCMFRVLYAAWLVVFYLYSLLIVRMPCLGWGWCWMSKRCGGVVRWINSCSWALTRFKGSKETAGGCILQCMPQ